MVYLTGKPLNWRLSWFGQVFVPSIEGELVVLYPYCCNLLIPIVLSPNTQHLYFSK